MVKIENTNQGPESMEGVNCLFVDQYKYSLSMFNKMNEEGVHKKKKSTWESRVW